MVVLIQYVDDIILIGYKITLKEKLTNEFQIRNLEILKYFLEMEFASGKLGEVFSSFTWRNKITWMQDGRNPYLVRFKIPSCYRKRSK